MKKRPSKRRIKARFMLGKWVMDQDMARHNLDWRVWDMPLEWNPFTYCVRRA